MKKILAILCAALMLVSMTACGAATTTETGADGSKIYTIGICQLIQHEALDAATEGFKQAVIDELGADLTYTAEGKAVAGDGTAVALTAAAAAGELITVKL